jgi:hypothetical protein
MKPIVEKILKSGLVSKHTAALMERWGSLEPGSVEMVGEEDLRKASKKTLMKFAEDIGELIESDRHEILETRLSIDVSEPMLVSTEYPDGIKKSIVVFKDMMGNYIFPPEIFVKEDMLFSTSDGIEWVVDEVTQLFKSHVKYATQVRVTSRAG